MVFNYDLSNIGFLIPRRPTVYAGLVIKPLTRIATPRTGDPINKTFSLFKSTQSFDRRLTTSLVTFTMIY